MKRAIGLAAVLFALGATGASAATYPDFSNNDPCYCAAQLKAHGHVGEIDKVNQGVGFIDSTFGRMIADAKAHGLVVGGYDFDQDYTAAEAYTFVAGLHRAGIYRGTPRTFPPTLDVEFGLPSKSGLEHQLAVLFREYGRAQIYTGPWYWLPHFGCWIPQGVTFWLSGYPVVSPFCGLNGNPFKVNAHQYTDHGATGASQVPYADVTRYLGSSFARFSQSGQTQAQLRALKVRSLHSHEANRRVLHRLVDQHHCRRGQHTTPRQPIRLRHIYHDRLCPRWVKHGKQDVAVIARYRREGIR